MNDVVASITDSDTDGTPITEESTKEILLAVSNVVESDIKVDEGQEDEANKAKNE